MFWHRQFGRFGRFVFGVVTISTATAVAMVVAFVLAYQTGTALGSL